MADLYPETAAPRNLSAPQQPANVESATPIPEGAFVVTRNLPTALPLRKTHELNAGERWCVRIFAAESDRAGAFLAPRVGIFLVCLPDVSNRREVLRYASRELRALADAGLVPEHDMRGVTGPAAHGKAAA